MSIADFVHQTTYTQEELSIALSVIKTFKECESYDEWFSIMFVSWQMLEELERQLEQMVGGAKE
jgi:hypothetical protein